MKGVREGGKIMYRKRDGCTSIQEVIERNIKMPVSDFLKPPQKTPYLYGLNEAVGFIRKHDVFKIVSDYDADGVMSTLIMTLILQKLNKNFSLIIPRRFSDGYGISPSILDRIDDGAIITIDNGIAAAEVIAEAKKTHPVFVVDHHLKRDDGILPDCGILDPHIESESDFKDYCGAGLAYRIANELIDDEDLLDICCIFASIATVADVVPLIGDNRTIVTKGIQLINEGKGTVGLRMLLQELGIEYIQESDYGYKLGPVINASGRLKDNGPEDVCKVLYFNKANPTARELDSLREAIQKLIELNELRKKYEKEEYPLVDPTDFPKKIIVSYHPNLHEGILGNLASKLVEKYSVPAIVLTNTKNGLLKGSGRSTEDIHLKKLLDSVSKYLEKYGGHKGAAGLSLRESNLESFRKALSDKLPDKKPVTDLFYDLEITPKEIPIALEELEKYRPFGEGNPEIVFLVKEIHAEVTRNSTYRLMGAEHQHIKIKSQGTSFLMFNMEERYRKDGYPIDITAIGTISANYFMGKKEPQVEIEDYKKEEKEKTTMFSFLKGQLDFTGGLNNV